jgi:hypothetical protein
MAITSVLFDGSKAAVEITMKTIEKQPELLEEVFNLCYEKYPVSMRAARVIQFYYEQHPDELIDYLPAIVDELLTTKVDGVKRSFLKILILTKNICELDKSALLFDKCIEWLLYEKESIAVKAYSIDLLEKFVKEEPELKNELIICFDNFPEMESIGLRKRMKNVIKSLKSQSI